MRATTHLAIAAALLFPGPRWFGADKLKHFLMSAMIQSAAYSTARAAGVERSTSQAIGGAATATFGVVKEIHDRRSRKPFSVEDLVWDAAGGVAAASLLNGTR
jgi:uncharacterized protein YfiM (DUF2279 family)